MTCDIPSANCERTQVWVDAYLSNELNPETTAEVGDHLRRCRECKEDFRSRQQIRNRLQRVVSHSEVPIGLRRRVCRMVRSFAERSPVFLSDLE